MGLALRKGTGLAWWPGVRCTGELTGIDVGLFLSTSWWSRPPLLWLPLNHCPAASPFFVSTKLSTLLTQICRPWSSSSTQATVWDVLVLEHGCRLRSRVKRWLLRGHVVVKPRLPFSSLSTISVPLPFWVGCPQCHTCLIGL